MNSLQAELRAMADAIALPDSDLHKRIESALHAAVKRVLLREPSEQATDIGANVYLEYQKPTDRGYQQQFDGMALAYRAMTAQLLREIEE